MEKLNIFILRDKHEREDISRDAQTTSRQGGANSENFQNSGRGRGKLIGFNRQFFADLLIKSRGSPVFLIFQGGYTPQHPPLGIPAYRSETLFMNTFTLLEHFICSLLGFFLFVFY